MRAFVMRMKSAIVVRDGDELAPLLRQFDLPEVGIGPEPPDTLLAFKRPAIDQSGRHAWCDPVPRHHPRA